MKMNYSYSSSGWLKFLTNSFILVGLVLFIAFVSLLLPNVFIFLVSIVLSSFVVSLFIKRDYFLSYFSSIILGFITLLLFCGGLGALLWILHIPISLSGIYLIATFLCLVILKITHRKGKLTPPSHFIDYKDFVGLVVILLYVSIYGYGVLKNSAPQTYLKISAIQNITYGIDDLTHLNMYKDTLEANKGLLLGSRDSKYISKKENISYPKMAHFIASILAKQTMDSWKTKSSKGIDYMLSYAVVKNLLFLTGVFVFCRSTLELWTRKRFNSFYAASIAFPLLFFSTILFINPFMQEGFFSIWPVIVYLPLTVLLLRDPLGDALSRQVILGLAISVIMLSWPLIAIPLYIILGILVIDELVKSKPKSKLILSINKILALVIPSLIGLVQLYVQLYDKSAPIDTSQLNAKGGIPGFAVIYILIFSIMAFTAIYLNFARNKVNPIKSKTSAASTYFILISLMIIISTGIGVMNIVSTASIQYFYIKTSYIVLLILSMFALLSFLDFIYNIAKPSKLSWDIGLSGIITPFIVSVSTVIVLFFSFNYSGENVRYLYDYLILGKRHVSDLSIKELINSSDSSDKQITNVINVDNENETYYLSVLARTTNHFNDCIGVSENIIIRNQVSNLDLCKMSPPIKFIVVDNLSKSNQVDQSRVEKAKNLLVRSGVKVTLVEKQVNY